MHQSLGLFWRVFPEGFSGMACNFPESYISPEISIISEQFAWMKKNHSKFDLMIEFKKNLFYRGVIQSAGI